MFPFNVKMESIKCIFPGILSDSGNTHEGAEGGLGHMVSCWPAVNVSQLM